LCSNADAELDGQGDVGEAGRDAEVVEHVAVWGDFFEALQ